MAGIKDLAGVWKNIREIDLRPFSMEAQRGVHIALLGAQSSELNNLADQMRGDPSRPDVWQHSPLLVVDLQAEGDIEARLKLADQTDLLILLKGSQPESQVFSAGAVRDWLAASQAPQVVVHIPAQGEDWQADPIVHNANWNRQRVLSGSLDAPGFMMGVFVPAVLDLLPDRHLALGRHYPLFRVPIAQKLINDSCLSNAAYSLSTGIAEIVPVFDLPLNITDMVVLSKAQAFLVYKLGLTLGFSTRWQDYLAEFGSVLGGGFLWRQIARQLVGLIPAWGIIPKVAVAYAGTYVVGNVVLQWYLTGRKVSKEQMRALYVEAFARGKSLARGMVSRVPRPRLKRVKQRSLLPPRGEQICTQCGKSSAADALFCQYCAAPLDQGEAE